MGHGVGPRPPHVAATLNPTETVASPISTESSLGKGWSGLISTPGPQIPCSSCEPLLDATEQAECWDFQQEVKDPRPLGEFWCVLESVDAGALGQTLARTLVPTLLGPPLLCTGSWRPLGVQCQLPAPAGRGRTIKREGRWWNLAPSGPSLSLV
ncbi:unnamed protein product [Rangifer tarandus platyrhynchus]|uniref:Uncharacterized protein n=1 Tax=Rangifer tarandus platyrhynchus TaxID=3082113 RepID=A0AC59Z0Q6_RANTA